MRRRTRRWATRKAEAEAYHDAANAVAAEEIAAANVDKDMYNDSDVEDEEEEDDKDDFEDDYEQYILV